MNTWLSLNVGGNQSKINHIEPIPYLYTYILYILNGKRYD